jgi:hypothetical protein
MLPKAENRPAARFKRGRYLSVPLSVPSQFLVPEADVGFRLRPVRRASVPEAAVDEYGHAGGRKDNVWASRQVAAVKPETQPMRMKGGTKSLLWFRVPALYPAHIQPALFRC